MIWAMVVRVDAVPVPGRRGVGLPLRLLGDERLARSVADGNDAAFAHLYERFHQPLYRYCRSLVGNDADAQDALQSALAAALVALRGGRRDAPLRPWLFRIVHNEAISLVRRRRPERQLPDDLGPPARSAQDTAEERARLATLFADLHELPERQRGALVMRELSGLRHEEVAQVLGISVGVAKQTVLEARRSLMEFEEGRAMACDQIQRIISDGDRRSLRGRRVRAHLRQCPGCTAFAEAIPARRAALSAIVPALPAASACGLLARLTGAGSGHGGSGAGVAAGAAGKAAGIAISGKALATGAAILVTAAVGAGTVTRLTASSPHLAPAAAGTGHTSSASRNATSRHLTATPGPSSAGAASRQAAAGHQTRGSASASANTTSGTSAAARGHHASAAHVPPAYGRAGAHGTGAAASHGHGISRPTKSHAPKVASPNPQPGTTSKHRKHSTSRHTQGNQAIGTFPANGSGGQGSQHSQSGSGGTGSSSTTTPAATTTTTTSRSTRAASKA
jgi:RNA polymerase sigma factor (sigma-70 family)